MRSTIRRRLLASSIICGLAAVSAPAFAQDEAGEVEELVVTGSRLARPDAAAAPQPLIQIGRDELIRSARPNIVDYLADVPALSGSQVPEDTVGPLGIGGVSTLNLRNLGTVRTLVLVDGRRHVGAPQGSLSVDVDTIPRLLIQDIDIVTGGQSALYGADAVSGVVNFVLRKDFEGVEIDGSLGEINSDGQLNRRITGLIGHNFLNGRLNAYLHAEYEENDEVKDADIPWRRAAWRLFNTAADVSATQADGIPDFILVRDARNFSRPIGGITVLASQILPNTPNIPLQACTPQAPNTAFSANCFSPEPWNAFVYPSQGTARFVNAGTLRDGSGYTRTINVGGDGRNVATEFSTASRLPKSENYRFQAGLNFAVTDNINLFAEAKYVDETTYQGNQGSFFDIGIYPVAAGQVPDFIGGTSTAINIGTDNVFLPTNVRDAILANTRDVINAQGVVTNRVADQRARHSIFTDEFLGVRNQLNQRSVQRYVVGANGKFDQLGFIQNPRWDLSYTYGRSENENKERAVDVVRFAYALDAVRDPATGQPTCRVKLTANPLNPLSTGSSGLQRATDLPYAAGDPIVAGCVPINTFGAGRLSQAAIDYVSAEINVTHVNQQQDFTAFASGELWDFWGAGPIAVGGGYEYRQEKARGTGRTASTAGRLLFLNTGPDFPNVKYDTNEFFGEVRVPLIKDLPFIQSAEIGGAYRNSDFSNIGKIETFSVTGFVQPIDDIAFRFSYGEATRVPNLSELYTAPTGTFGNNLIDPCDANGFGTGQTALNRRANCASLLGAGYVPGTTRITYTSGVPGFNAGNASLEAEESRSYTASIILRPRFMPRFTAVFDYYDIKITNLINAVTIQDLLNNCVSGTVVNQNACSQFSRDPSTFLLTTFVQGVLNYAATEAKGVDFTFSYNMDVPQFGGKDWGRLDWRMRGNYLIRQEDFLNTSDPSDATEFDSLLGLPRVRFLSTVTWTPRSWLRFTWDWDWQASQEIADSDVFIQDTDIFNPKFRDTGDFSQHDFSVAWDVREDLTLRAGVVNAFNKQPAKWVMFNDYLAGTVQSAESSSAPDNFDLFGRRFFIGVNFRPW